jgi:hypothetical protein
MLDNGIRFPEHRRSSVAHVFYPAKQRRCAIKEHGSSKCDLRVLLRLESSNERCIVYTRKH